MKKFFITVCLVITIPFFNAFSAVISNQLCYYDDVTGNQICSSDGLGLITDPIVVDPGTGGGITPIQQCPRTYYQCPNIGTADIIYYNGSNTCCNGGISYSCSGCPSTTCLSNQYKLNGACTACPPGYKCDGTTATICSKGSYSTGSATSCTSCPGGTTTSGTGATSSSACNIILCPANSTLNPFQDICFCNAGYYNTNTLSYGGYAYVYTGETCSPCDAGYYCQEAPETSPWVQTRFKCPAGSYCPAGSTSPTTCPAGTTSAAGASSCYCALSYWDNSSNCYMQGLGATCSGKSCTIPSGKTVSGWFIHGDYLAGNAIGTSTEYATLTNNGTISTDSGVMRTTSYLNIVNYATMWWWFNHGANVYGNITLKSGSQSNIAIVNASALHGNVTVESGATLRQTSTTVNNNYRAFWILSNSQFDGTLINNGTIHSPNNNPIRNDSSYVFKYQGSGTITYGSNKPYSVGGWSISNFNRTPYEFTGGSVTYSNSTISIHADQTRFAGSATTLGPGITLNFKNAAGTGKIPLGTYTISNTTLTQSYTSQLANNGSTSGWAANSTRTLSGTTFTYSCNSGYTPSADKLSCQVASCPAGQYLNGSTCSPCPPGSYCTGGTASYTTCPATSGKMYEESPANGTSNAGAKAATDCYLSGQYYWDGTGYVVGTTTGNTGTCFYDGSAMVYGNCPSGKSYHVCTQGYYTTKTGAASGFADKCVPVPVGYYDVPNISQRLRDGTIVYREQDWNQRGSYNSCPAGRTTSSTGSTSSSACSISLCPANSREISSSDPRYCACNPGYYDTNDDDNSLVYNSGEGCHLCPRGSYCPGTQWVKSNIACPNGTTEYAGSTSSNACITANFTLSNITTYGIAPAKDASGNKYRVGYRNGMTPGEIGVERCNSTLNWPDCYPNCDFSKTGCY